MGGDVLTADFLNGLVDLVRIRVILQGIPVCGECLHFQAASRIEVSELQMVLAFFRLHLCCSHEVLFCFVASPWNACERQSSAKDIFCIPGVKTHSPVEGLLGAPKVSLVKLLHSLVVLS